MSLLMMTTRGGQRFATAVLEEEWAPEMHMHAHMHTTSTLTHAHEGRYEGKQSVHTHTCTTQKTLLSPDAPIAN